MKRIASVFYLCTTGLILLACTKSSTSQPPPPPPDTILINLSHLNYLYTPVTFPNGVNAAGIYIYSEAPDYHLVEASGEGFSCVDDVSRAALVYIRSKNFSSDTNIAGKGDQPGEVHAPDAIGQRIFLQFFIYKWIDQ
jgi:hypothetical protein